MENKPIYDFRTIKKMHKINVGEENIVLLLDGEDVYVYVKHHQIKVPLIKFTMFGYYTSAIGSNISFRLNEKKTPYPWWNPLPAFEKERIDSWMYEGEEQISVYLNKAKLLALQFKIELWKKKN